MTNHPWLVGIGCAVLAIFALSLWLQWVQDNKRARLAGRPPVRFRAVLGDMALDVVGSIAAGVWDWMRKRVDGLRRPFRGWAAYRASFVYGQELLGWPKVRRMGPGHFVMSAPHMGPRRMQQYGGWKPPVFTGVALGLLFALRPGTEPGAFWPIWIFMGAIFGFLSIPFWHWMQRTRLKIHFIGGAMSWRGPDRRKYAYKPGAWRELIVVAPHRLADDEARQHQNFMAANSRGQRPDPIFQISSELVMQIGLAGTVFVPVAEFHDDLSEELAGRLRAAMVFVFKELLEEMEAREGA